MRKMPSRILKVKMYGDPFSQRFQEEIEKIISQNKESILRSLGYIYERQIPRDT